MKDTSRMVCQAHMHEGFSWLTSYVVENKFFCVFESPRRGDRAQTLGAVQVADNQYIPVTSVVAPKKKSTRTRRAGTCSPSTLKSTRRTPISGSDWGLAARRLFLRSTFGFRRPRQ